MKAMLSQPMAGKSEKEIKATREKAIAVLEEKGYEIVNTLFTDEWYSRKSMEERGGCTDSIMFSCEITGKHEPLSCCLFLQRLGRGKRLSH